MTAAWIFDGSDYVPAADNARLNSQLQRIWNVMLDGKWRTLAQIEKLTGDPPASISAQLRHMRKPRFGGHTVRKLNSGGGLFWYKLVPNGVLLDGHR